MRKNTNDKSFFIILFTCFAFFIFLVYQSKPNIADDAYIFLRIVKNILSGYGYVFNKGIPVEGGTSLLWVILLTGLTATGAPIEPTVRLLSLTTGILIISTLWVQFRVEKYALSTILLLLFILITNHAFQIPTNKGMETGLYAFLLLLLLIIQLRKFPPFITGIIGILLFMTRPESILTLFTLGLWMVWILRSSSQKLLTRKNVVTIILIWLIGILAITTWRWFTFGAIIPNSAMAKSPGLQIFSDPRFFIIRIGFGILYILGWIKQSWLIILSALVGSIFVFRHDKYQLGLFTSFIIPSLAIVLASGGDWMAHYRLLMPLLPLLLLLSGEFANFLHTKYSETHYPKLEYVFAFILCITSLITLKNETENTKAGSKFLNCYGHVGEVVASALPENATIAPEGIGKIGYVLPDYEIYDFLGLVDPYTAKNGTMPSPNFTYGKVHYPHMMEIKPEIFIFHTPNFFEPLRNLGYEKEYETYQIKTVPCDFLWIGIRNDVVSETRQRLETKFKIELYK